MDKGVYGDSCTFSASAVGLPFFFQGTTSRNADPAKLGFPSFTPKLSSPAPFAFVIKKSRSLGKGGMLYYNGTKADFDNLKKQADDYAKQKINEHEITQEARKKAAELVAAAEQRAKEVMRAAGEYCEDAMKRTEDVMSRSLEELKQSHVQFRQAIREQQNNH